MLCIVACVNATHFLGHSYTPLNIQLNAPKQEKCEPVLIT